MKKVFLFICLLMLVGCATQNAYSPATSAKKIVYLKGKTTSQIRKLMGKPALKRTEEPNQLWAYRTNECSVLVFFDAKGKSQYAETRGVCERMLAKLM